jgi:hypothetical protein
MLLLLLLLLPDALLLGTEESMLLLIKVLACFMPFNADASSGHKASVAS